MREGFRSANENSAQHERNKKAIQDRIRQLLEDNVLKPKELLKKAEAAEKEAEARIGTAWKQGLRGEPFRANFAINPNDKGAFAVEELSERIRDSVEAFPVIKSDSVLEPDPVTELIEALSSGTLRGEPALLKEAAETGTLSHAPFVLLSNKDEPLAEDKKISHLRTVLVNGQYESLADELRKAFPWVSFRTAAQLEDRIFDQKSPSFVSYEDRIEAKAEEALRKQSELPRAA